MRNKHISELTTKLKLIESSAYCHRKIYKAWKVFDEIKILLNPADAQTLYRDLLELDPEYPDYIATKEVRARNSEILSEDIKRIIANAV